MGSFDIGISGLNAAQRGLDIIGNNIANAATPGYHRQRLELDPAYFAQFGEIFIGGGVEIGDVTRLIDGLLEREMLRQQSSLAQASQEFSTLYTVESTLGELSTGTGLQALIDRFFNSLDDLSAYPDGGVEQTQVVTEAQAMANQFRMLGSYLDDLDNQIVIEANNVIGQVNTLTTRIAELNNDIKEMELVGKQANNILDQRDQYISELSELIGVQTISMDDGVVNVIAGGIAVVIGSTSLDLESGLDSSNDLGIRIAGSSNYNTNIEGGKLGGLISLKNETIADIETDLNSLAKALIQQINQYHVQGIGSQGSFTQLTGWSNTTGDLSSFSDVSAGYVYIRVTNTSTGAVTRTAVR